MITFWNKQFYFLSRFLKLKARDEKCIFQAWLLSQCWWMNPVLRGLKIYELHFPLWIQLSLLKSFFTRQRHFSLRLSQSFFEAVLGLVPLPIELRMLPDPFRSPVSAQSHPPSWKLPTSLVLSRNLSRDWLAPACRQERREKIGAEIREEGLKRSSIRTGSDVISRIDINMDTEPQSFLSDCACQPYYQHAL